MKLDLSFGNPSFLQEIWERLITPQNHSFDSLMPYKFVKGYTEELKEQIFALHKNNKNCLITDQSQVILTVGGSGAIQASLWAYKEFLGKDRVRVPVPYWGYFDHFASVSGVKISQQGDFSLITSPNNPNGEPQNEPTQIRDACYNWSYYTKSVQEFSDPVVCFSLAKLSGHASSRFGWAIVQDPEIAKLMNKFVNLTTIGVSVEAQVHALSILKSLNSDNKFMEEAKNKLDKRWKKILETTSMYRIPFKFLSYNGLFLYIQCDPSVIEKLNIIVSKGTDFHDSTPDSYRLNLGCSDEEFKELIKRMRNL